MLLGLCGNVYSKYNIIFYKFDFYCKIINIIMHINSNKLLNNVTNLLLVLKHNMYNNIYIIVLPIHVGNHNIIMLEKI